MDTSRLRTCLKKLQTPIITVLGTGIYCLAALTSYWTFWEDHEFPDTKEKNLMSIYDLEEIIRKRALAMYKMNQESTSCFPRKHTKPELNLNWDDVVEYQYPDDIKFTEIKKFPLKKDPTHVIFQTVFRNAGYTDQYHKLRAEGHTSMVCNSHLTEGFSKGSEVGLSFSTPIQNTNSTIKFQKGFSIINTEKNFKETKIAWVIDDFIYVPRQTKITVSKSVKKRKQDFSFIGKIGFKGSVKAIFKDKKTNSIIHTIPIPIKTIIHEELPEYITIIKSVENQSTEKEEKDTKDGEKKLIITKENIEKREEDIKDGQKYLKNDKENIEKGEEYGVKDLKNVKENIEKGEEDRKDEETDLKSVKEDIEQGEEDKQDLKIAKETIEKGVEGIRDGQKDLKNANESIDKGEKRLKYGNKDAKNVKENNKNGEDDLKDEQEDISYIIIKGRCQFEYEVEQEIDIDEQMVLQLVSTQCSET